MFARVVDTKADGVEAGETGAGDVQVIDLGALAGDDRSPKPVPRHAPRASDPHSGADHAS